MHLFIWALEAKQTTIPFGTDLAILTIRFIKIVKVKFT